MGEYPHISTWCARFDSKINQCMHGKTTCMEGTKKCNRFVLKKNAFNLLKPEKKTWWNTEPAYFSKMHYKDSAGVRF